MSVVLSVKQLEILSFIISFFDELGYPPTIREIGKEVNLKSTSSVHWNLNKLEEFGLIKRNPTRPRSITIFHDKCTNLLK